MQTLPDETLDESAMPFDEGDDKIIRCYVAPEEFKYLCIKCGDDQSFKFGAGRAIIYGFCSCYKTARRERDV